MKRCLYCIICIAIELLPVVTHGEILDVDTKTKDQAINCKAGNPSEERPG